MAECTIPVAIRHVGDLTSYRHIHDGVFETRVRMFTEGAGLVVLPVCRTRCLHDEVTVVQCDTCELGHVHFLLWLEEGGVSAAVAVLGTSLITLAGKVVLCIVLAVCPGNKSYKFNLKYQLSSYN